MRTLIAIALICSGCVYPSCEEWWWGGSGVSETCRELSVDDWGSRPVLVGVTHEQRNHVLAQIRGLGIRVVRGPTEGPYAETPHQHEGVIYLPWEPGYHFDPAFELRVLTHELQHVVQYHGRDNFSWLYTHDDGYRAWYELEAYSAEFDVSLAFGHGEPEELDWSDHWFIGFYKLDTPPAVLNAFEGAFARKRTNGRLTSKASALVLQWIVDYNEVRYGA